MGEEHDWNIDQNPVVVVNVTFEFFVILQHNEVDDVTEHDAIYEQLKRFQLAFPGSSNNAVYIWNPILLNVPSTEDAKDVGNDVFYKQCIDDGLVFEIITFINGYEFIGIH